VSFACATVLSFYAPRAAPAFFVLAAAIAWSRVYVGVHYPLDVVGGAALGVGIAIALRWLTEALRRSRPATRAGCSRPASRGRSGAGTRRGSRSGGSGRRSGKASRAQSPPGSPGCSGATRSQPL